MKTEWLQTKQLASKRGSAAPQIDRARSRYRMYRTPFHSLRDASKIEQYLSGSKPCQPV